MITLINPPGLKTFSGLQMHTPNPPLGLAYVAAAVREAGFPYRVIDGTGEALDAVSPYPDRSDFMVQGLTFEQIVERIPPASDVIGISCMFSTLWPLTRKLAERVRARFPRALLVLGGEHGTAVPEHVLHAGTFDVVVLGEGEETLVDSLRARTAGLPLPVHVLLEPGHVDAALDPARPEAARRRDGALRGEVRRDELRLPGPHRAREAAVDRGLLPRADRPASRRHVADAERNAFGGLRRRGRRPAVPGGGPRARVRARVRLARGPDRKSTRLNSSHSQNS